jgi:hypothetical protein
MTSEMLTSLLAQRVLGWTVAPERFLMSNRRWMPRWRFQPIERLPDAIRLLEAAAAERFEISADKNGLLSVRVNIRGMTGKAQDRSRPRAITLAIAQALQINVDSLESPDCFAGMSAGLSSKRKPERQ